MRLPPWFFGGSPGHQLSLRWRAARDVLVPVGLRIYSRWPAGCPGARVQRLDYLGALLVVLTLVRLFFVSTQSVNVTKCST